MSIYSEKPYCTYLTIYLGSKMPMFYIGSTSIKRINGGYRGSVRSKEYGLTWRIELKKNPHLFKTKILTSHNNRREALDRELSFHRYCNIPRNKMFINKARATHNGFFGMDNSGKNHPRYGTGATYHNKGIPLSESTKILIGIANKGRSFTDEHKERISRTLLGQKLTSEHKQNISFAVSGDKNGFFGKNHTQESIEKNRIAHLGKPCHHKGKPQETSTCPFCGKIGGKSVMLRWHFDKCKSKS